ncbi:putative repeat protein (TIGR01451 family) [Isoptericola jiangsuensis]|uniref:Putative repeat protein (TIGR01451 family) n=1 Tax=Isoptericola jiangsuensis TaxID=548579 RepID=A0A2A9ETL1_9MICO|nr:putative repeat protein (TIGR01451 family) [Isoptericola jiangsuensis]
MLAGVLGSAPATASTVDPDPDGPVLAAPEEAPGHVPPAARLALSFDPPTTPVGTPVTLTFALTGSGDPATSFTDVLPEGLVVADPANATATCDGPAWDPAPGTGTVSVTAAVPPPGSGSCTLDVDVTSAVPGAYTNGADDVTDLVGSAPPGDTARVEFTDDASGPTLTVVRTADASVVEPGDTLTSTVTVSNTGEVPYPADGPATVVDDLTEVLDDAELVAAEADVGSVDDAALPLLTWSGPLDVGETATITTTVRVDDPARGDLRLDDVVTGPPGSSCTDGTEEGCATSIPVRRLEVATAVDVDSAVPGGAVEVTTTVANTGWAAFTLADPATVTDDATGLVDDAAYDGDASADVGAVDDAAFPLLTWVGALAPGESATITWSATVDVPTDGDLVLDRAVTGGSCAEGDGPPCATSTPVRALTVEASVDAAEVRPGETLTWTVVVTNDGQVDYGPRDPVVVVDDLTGVLAGATWVGASASAGELDVSALPRLEWTGTPEVGGSATIAFSATVSPDAAGVLADGLTGPPESTCPTGGEPGCRAATVVVPAAGVVPGDPTPEPSTGASSVAPVAPDDASTPPGRAGQEVSTPPATTVDDAAPLAWTGTDVAAVVAVAVLLLVTGAVLVAGARRRRGGG